MPNFYSPNGNFEVWENKPEGYYTIEEWQAMHPAPLPTLEEVKANKIAEFKYKRDSEEVTLIEYNNHFYDYDSKARERINAAITTLEITGATVQWTTADNDDVELSATDLKNIVMAVAYRSNLLHIKCRQLKEQVNLCTTIAEVEAVSWEE